MADGRMTNEQALFDFFQEAMAGVILTHAALDNFATEFIPEDFLFDDEGKQLNRSNLEQRGIELRLSRVLSAALGKPNLRIAEPDLWKRVSQLKKLRDDIHHQRAPGAYSADPGGTIFADLLKEWDCLELVDTVNRVMTHYGYGLTSGD
jgi:hypothetical protein